MPTSVTNSVYRSNNLHFQNASKISKNSKAKTASRPQGDAFEKKIDKSNNGKFDLSEAVKNFAKGVISPLTAIVKHPVITLATLGVTAAACSLIPILTPILGIGFGALSVFQLAKGCVDVAKNIKNKEYDKAEKSFNTVGQGTVGTVLSVLGLKQSAKIAKEAKLMNELKVKSLSTAQKEAIAEEVSKGSNIDALKEITSLFTSKTGLKAVANQFRPSNILQRGKDAVKFLFGKKEKTDKIIRKRAKFKDTPEGKRRAALSTQEIEAEVRSLAKEAFDEYGVPEELRPEIKIVKGGIEYGGGYRSASHRIEINENAYREGAFELPNVIKHEATHASGAILRQRLPMDEKIRLAKEYLINRIQNGEKENIITDTNLLGVKTSNPPKLNAQMKADFIKLAKDKLYVENAIYTDSDFAQMVRPLVEANSEFTAGYSSVDDAVNAMVQYAKSHYIRYNAALKCSAGFNTSNIDSSLLRQLTPEEMQAAVKSYLDAIECTEANAAGRGSIFGIGADFNQYQFCSEEVLAQVRGNNFEIAKLEQQLKALQAQPKRNFREEARIADLIKQAQTTIEYKMKGADFYKLYTESINHPENQELAAKVAKLKAELDVLQKQMSKTHEIVYTGTDPEVLSTNYVITSEIKRQPTGASIGIPYATTAASDIIADDIEEKNKSKA